MGSPDPHTDTTTSGHLLRDAWDGALYTFRNPTLRGLGFSIAVLNLAQGTTAIVLPLIVFDRLHGSELLVGLLFAVSGVFGCVAALASGRLDTRGMEWRLLVAPMALYPASVVLLLATGNVWLVAASMAISGLLNGPMDIALFTIRQRRTDPSLMGRAFAVSMSLNFLGFPVGSAVAGSWRPFRWRRPSCSRSWPRRWPPCWRRPRCHGRTSAPRSPAACARAQEPSTSRLAWLDSSSVRSRPRGGGPVRQCGRPAPPRRRASGLARVRRGPLGRRTRRAALGPARTCRTAATADQEATSEHVDRLQLAGPGARETMRRATLGAQAGEPFANVRRP